MNVNISTPMQNHMSDQIHDDDNTTPKSKPDDILDSINNIHEGTAGIHYYFFSKEDDLSESPSSGGLFYPSVDCALAPQGAVGKSAHDGDKYYVYVPQQLDKLKLYGSNSFGLRESPLKADKSIKLRKVGQIVVMRKGVEADYEWLYRYAVNESDGGLGDELDIIRSQWLDTPGRSKPITLDFLRELAKEYGSIHDESAIVPELTGNPTYKDKEPFIKLMDNTDPNHIYLSSDWHIFKDHYKNEKNEVNVKEIVSWCEDHIKPDDIFMYLGDISFRYIDEKDKEASQKIMHKIPGHKILILGNHDVFINEDYYTKCGFEYVFQEFEWNNIIFSHRPLKMETDPKKLNIHGHMHKEVTYRTSNGNQHVNVYPAFYNNKPITLQFILDNKDKLMKDHVWQPNYGYGEAAMPESRIASIISELTYGVDLDLLANMTDKRIASKPIVYFTKDISPAGILNILKTMKDRLYNKLAIKLHFGEKGNTNFLSPKLLTDSIEYLKTNNFVQDITLVDCNTAYEGSKRLTTESHLKVAKEHGFTDLAPVRILDADGDMRLGNPYKDKIDAELQKIHSGKIAKYESIICDCKHLDHINVGAGLKDYDNLLVYTHVKGHTIAGFGGAIKNIGMGLASGKTGKLQIHGKDFGDLGHEFLEKLTESAGAIQAYFDGKIMFINVLANMSLECDCHGDPKIKPVMSDIGVLASTDLVAIEQASFDLIRESDDSGELMDHMHNKAAHHIIEYATWLGMSIPEYTLKEI